MPVIPKPAATVILMREISSGSVEVFLLKRHEANAFMGGNFVYPGGKMDSGDIDGSIFPYCRGIDMPSSGSESGAAGETDFGYRTCAIRELFEEAGILLAYNTSGEFYAVDSLQDKDRLDDYRRSVQKRVTSMAELARRESLSYAVDALLYLDRWITPEARNMRFDTRFYLAFCPEGQEASSDQLETVQGLWVSPKDALKANLEAQIALSPPAVETLELLSPFETKVSVLNFIKHRQPRIVLPILANAVDGSVILFPWDEEYGPLSRAEIRQPRPSRLREPNEKTTRVLLRDGRWLPCRPGEKTS